MIVEMFIDIRIFLLIFFVGILAFSNCFYIFDMYSRLKGQTTIAGNSYIDAFIYVYLQSLGELGFDAYDDSYSPSVYWVFFFISSLFLQITLLNVLIAIMGDTFDRIQEVQREAKTKKICSLLSEYASLIPQDEIASNSCIYIASHDNKEEAEGTGSSWEGKLAALKTYLTKEVEKIGLAVEKSTERLESKNS